MGPTNDLVKQHELDVGATHAPYGLLETSLKWSQDCIRACILIRAAGINDAFTVESESGESLQSRVQRRRILTEDCP